MTTALAVKTDVPLLLLPVRLETHFVRSATGTQLLVRIYPDDVHVDSHEPRLTASEIAWGKHFWLQTWLAGNSEPRLRAAWGQLAEQFGPARAAYIVEKLTPSEAGSRPSTPSDALTDDRFPKPVERPDDEWPKPPQTHVLPDRWTAIGYAAGQRFTHTGKTITMPLALAPTLDASGGGFDAETMAKDPNAAWLVDFTAAVDAGMALSIPYPAPYGTPLERLLVVGVKADLPKEKGQELLENLLAAHRYAEGLGFVLQGTATNNTDEGRSGYTPLQETSVAGPLTEVTRATMPFAPGDGSNGDMTARALGVNSRVFAAIEQSSATEQRDAYHMNVAAWKATWGYFLEHMMSGPDSPSANAIRHGREHFSSYVRARGPLPVLRIGRQPYGVLPAMSLQDWKNVEQGLIDPAVVNAIRALRDVWRQSLENVPRIPRREDSAAELVKILAMLPTSANFSARPAQPLAATATAAADARTGSAAARKLAAAIGISWIPRQRRVLFAQYQRLVAITNLLVQGPVPEVLSDTGKLSPNYLEWLISATWRQLREGITPPPDVLLYLLLRHAGLHEYASAAVRVLVRRTVITDLENAREADIAERQVRTPWKLLETEVATATAIGDFLDAVIKPVVQGDLTKPDPTDVTSLGAIWRRDIYEVTEPTVPADLTDDLREFAAFQRSVRYLSNRPAARLAGLVPEVLDLASHRLDAWATSFAAKRLESLRRTAPFGIAIGGYGYVEDVVSIDRDSTTKPVVPADEQAPELDGTVFESASNHGYVQAPSLAHATTAAILRSGYLSRRASGDGNVMAVNLSSQRVRTALYLLEGVRGGQSLSALLGYRFERGLHENHPNVRLDHYIPSFRALAPMPGDLPVTRQSQGAIESLAARNVVDGLALLKRYRAGRPGLWTTATIPFGAPVAPVTSVALPPADLDDPQFAAIEAELRLLDDAVDAISDLTIAEAVHQIAQGNTARAGAALESIALGEAPPPELEVIETPRTGIGLTHRLLVLFSGEPPAPTWVAPTPRSHAEPFLSAWASQLLGPAAKDAICRVTYLDPEKGEPQMDAEGRPLHVDVSLSELGLGPLDIVYLAEDAREAQAGELEQRFAFHALQQPPVGVRPAAVQATASLRLSFRAGPDWPAAALSVAEVLEVARSARRLMTSARAMTPGDLALPDAAIPESADNDIEPPSEPAASAERLLRLPFRAKTAVEAFSATSQALLDALAVAGKSMLAAENSRMLLIGVAAYGVPGAFPISAVGSGPPDQAALHTQAQSVARELSARLARLEALDKAYPGAAVATAVQTRDYHLARLREVFGEEFRVVPRFTPVEPATLKATFEASTTLQDNEPLTVVTWLLRAARVRDGASRLASALMYGEAMGSAGMNVLVGQLPYGDNKDRWVGLERTPLGGRVSLVVQAPTRVDVARPLAGLFVDEWVEVVPSAVETTGLTFHFNRPNARAPQTILLAVPPDDRATWDVETLEATVDETLQWAKLRTIDLSALGEVGQFLPALYFADPSSGHTINSDLGGLATG